MFSIKLLGIGDAGRILTSITGITASILAVGRPRRWLSYISPGFPVQNFL